MKYETSVFSVLEDNRKRKATISMYFSHSRDAFPTLQVKFSFFNRTIMCVNIFWRYCSVVNRTHKMFGM